MSVSQVFVICHVVQIKIASCSHETVISNSDLTIALHDKQFVSNYGNKTLHFMMCDCHISVKITWAVCGKSGILPCRKSGSRFTLLIYFSLPVAACEVYNYVISCDSFHAVRVTEVMADIFCLDTFVL